MRNTMGEHVIVLDGSSLEIRDVFDVGYSGAKVKIAESALEAMTVSRSAVMRILESDEVVYGINTGFGALSRVTIEHDQLEELQYNLIRSHACATRLCSSQRLAQLSVSMARCAPVTLAIQRCSSSRAYASRHGRSFHRCCSLGRACCR